MTQRKPPPKRIYLERWPDGEDDQIHYTPTGYGISMRSGQTSRIYVYRRVTERELAAERKAKKR